MITISSYQLVAYLDSLFEKILRPMSIMSSIRELALGNELVVCVEMA